VQVVLRAPASAAAALCPISPPGGFSMLDVLYIVIGIVSFVATILYLPACDSL
jgi:hypothetical protein